MTVITISRHQPARGTFLTCPHCSGTDFGVVQSRGRIQKLWCASRTCDGETAIPVTNNVIQTKEVL